MIVDSERLFIEDSKIIDISKLGGYFEVKLESKYISKHIQPGQFVNIKLRTPLLRRPFTLFDKEHNSFSILVKVVGKGTEELTKMKASQTVNIIGPLGNSVFDFGIHNEEKVNLVAGGVGIANMVSLAKLLKTSKRKVRLFWGIRSKEEYFEKYFEYVDEIFISTEDGSIGCKGFITELLERKYDGNMIYACGPTPMLKSLSKIHVNPEKVIVSLETFMGCGIGICYGCSIPSSENGYILVCKDGPNVPLNKIVIP
ncbi:MAG: dihydroorotate dehydrogenase electron transfer subunit [Brevinematales bacterium]|nr:dihydroorotate dehydrogenase electron transfer subunit [Brevinematales bacterium]